MPIMFRRIRGRAAGHVVAVNSLLVRELQPTRWGGTDIVYSDVHVTTSRDDPSTVLSLLEGRLRVCGTHLCDRLTTTPYQPVCERCGAGHAPDHRLVLQEVDEVYEAAVADLMPAMLPSGFRS